MTRVATIPLQRTMADAIQRAQQNLAKTQTSLSTGKKAQDYAFSEFAMSDVIDKWDHALTDLTSNWRQKYVRWDVREI